MGCWSVRGPLFAFYFVLSCEYINNIGTRVADTEARPSIYSNKCVDGQISMFASVYVLY